MAHTRFTCSPTRADETRKRVIRTGNDRGLRRCQRPRVSSSRCRRAQRHHRRPGRLGRFQGPQRVGTQGPGAGRGTKQTRSCLDCDRSYEFPQLSSVNIKWSGAGRTADLPLMTGSFALPSPERDYRHAAKLGACASDEPIGTVVGRAPGSNPIQTRTSADENGSRSSYCTYLDQSGRLRAPNRHR
jgi:hypothetical protein